MQFSTFYGEFPTCFLIFFGLMLFLFLQIRSEGGGAFARLIRPIPKQGRVFSRLFGEELPDPRILVVDEEYSPYKIAKRDQAKPPPGGKKTTGTSQSTNKGEKDTPIKIRKN